MPKDTEAIEKRVIQILADKLDIDAEKIKPESKLMEDLGMDSFGAIEMVFELEEAFGINISDKDLEKIKVVNDVIEYIKNFQKL